MKSADAALFPASPIGTSLLLETPLLPLLPLRVTLSKSIDDGAPARRCCCRLPPPPPPVVLVSTLKKHVIAAAKQYKAETTNIPKQVNGNANILDKKLPQNETQFTTRSRFVLPHPGTKHGQSIMLTTVNTTLGTPNTNICNALNTRAMHTVHRNGSSFSSNCIFAHPRKFHHRKCSGNAPSSTISEHSQQKCVPQLPHFI
mmetsp:Transcript_9160/g.16560  ORF Transcript_9160/g.16560 Transcript_9160/m.16560 type:complete len:201 (+) Transcript_9160:357-959(+)